MRLTNYIQELFTNYKIEKWDNKKNNWKHYQGFINHNDAVQSYRNILKNEKGIYRLIKVIEIDER